MESKKSNNKVLLIIGVSLVGVFVLCLCAVVVVFAVDIYTSKNRINDYPNLQIVTPTNIPIPSEKPINDIEFPTGDDLEIIDEDNSKGSQFDSITEFPIIVDRNAEFEYSAVETVYNFYINDFYERYDGEVIVGSPRITDDKVEIDLTVDGVQNELWFVKIEEFPDSTVTVGVGLPNAGMDEIYHLEPTGAVWAIFEIEEVSF